MKRLESFAVNVASVITEGQVSGVAAFPALQTQFGDVCASGRGLGRGVSAARVVLMFQQASFDPTRPAAVKTKQRRLNVSELANSSVDNAPLPSFYFFAFLCRLPHIAPFARC